MTHSTDSSAAVRRAGLILGPVLCSALLAAGPVGGIGQTGLAVAAVGALMAVWWMTEALPLAATALVPLVAFPLLGAGSLESTAGSYADPVIFLFLGGFLIARAMERWQLHHRLALAAMRVGGGNPRALIASLMAATAFISMWVSNTATAIVMVPIGQSIIASYARVEGDAARDGFAPAMMLGIAFAATIGGLATLIGTPPNALLAAYLANAHGITIGFAQWMLVGLPAALILLPITWLLLTRISFRVPGEMRLSLREDAPALPPLSRAAKLVLAIAGLTAVMLILRPLFGRLLPAVPLSDAGIAMAGALLLFALPAGGGDRLLTWREAKDIRWDVLILFGGGLALAGGIDDSGLAQRIAGGFAALDWLPLGLLILLAMAVVVYLGELASNTAMAAIFLPIAGAAAIGMGETPVTLAVPVALAASLGFMLPVATPPNAIVFGSGAVSAPQMLKVGAMLDVVGILVVYAVAVLLAPLVFG